MNSISNSFQFNYNPALFDPLISLKTSAAENSNSLTFSPLSLKSRIETYDDIIMNIEKVDKQKIEDKMVFLSEEKMNNIVKNVLLNPDLLDPIWNEVDFPLYCLRALKDNLINGMTFTTSQLFYNALNHPVNKNEFTIIPMFINNQQSSEAWNFIQQSAQPFQSFNETDRSILTTFITPEEQRILFDLVQKLPLLEQVFLLVPEPESNDPLSPHLTQKIQNLFPYFNVFGTVFDSFGKKWRMIPSKGMLQSYIFATGGDCTLISQFLLSSKDYLKEGILKGERPMCLNFAFFKQVEDIHDSLTLSQFNTVEYHDLYHIDIMKYLKKDRFKFYAIIEILEKVLIKSQDDKDSDIIENIIKIQLIKEFIEVFVDAEFYDYRYLSLINKIDKEKKEMFWLTVFKIIHSRFNCDCRFNCDLEAEVDAPIEIQIWEELISKITQNSDYYKTNYDLTLDFLLQSKEDIHKSWSMVEDDLISKTSSQKLKEILKLIKSDEEKAMKKLPGIQAILSKYLRLQENLS